MMKSRSWILFILLQILFFCFFLVSNLWFCSEAKDYSLTTLSRDEAMRYKDRFKGLRPLLPVHARIGYFTDRDIKEYFFTQYNLIPNVIFPGREMDYILDDFQDENPLSSIPDRPGYERIYDDGHGLILSRREKR